MAADPFIEPDALPEWGTSISGGDIADPGPLKASGWTALFRKVGMQHLNWLFNTGWRWHAYFRDLMAWSMPDPFIPPGQASPEPLAVSRVGLDLSCDLSEYKVWIAGRMLQLGSGTATLDLTSNVPADPAEYRWVVVGIYHTFTDQIDAIEGPVMGALPTAADIPDTGAGFLPLLGVLLRGDGAVLDLRDLRRFSPLLVRAANIQPQQLSAMDVLQPQSIDFSLLSLGAVYQQHLKSRQYQVRLTGPVTQVINSGASTVTLSLPLEVVDLEGQPPGVDLPIDLHLQLFRHLDGAIADTWSQYADDSAGAGEYFILGALGSGVELLQVGTTEAGWSFSPCQVRVTSQAFELQLQATTPCPEHDIVLMLTPIGRPGSTSRIEHALAAIPF